jgi:hypothetical protein
LYEPPWRNKRWELYTQCCRLDEVPNLKLRKLLKIYGTAFDDEWWYYLNRSGLMAFRVPLWQKQKRIGMEKHKPGVFLTPTQTRLSDHSK